MTDRDAAALPDAVAIAIVGAGFAGIGMAAQLRRAGVEDFVVLDRAEAVGGTWRTNTYPGCSCDVPSHLYSFSFAPHPGWSRTYAPQAEILAYLGRVVDDEGLRPYLRLGCTVEGGHWDEGSATWELTTSRGPLRATSVVAAMGAQSAPRWPSIPGLESFAGHRVHSAAWDEGHVFSGERVAVIGTGASAVQIVPALAKQAAHVDVYQRTPNWILPRGDRSLRPVERLALRRVPALGRVRRALTYWTREAAVIGLRHPRIMRAIPQRAAGRHLKRQVPDPSLRARLTPQHTMGCKRIMVSDDYYPALGEPHVELVTDSIESISPRGIRTHDGIERPVDTLVCATGFNVGRSAADRLRGRDGRTLGETWAGGAQALHGTTVAGFPNLYLLVGPNTGVAHTSVVFMIESQVAHVIACLDALRRTGAESIEPRRDAQRVYNERLQAATQGSVWTRGGCSSWYLDGDGVNRVLWPGFSWRFRAQTRRARPAEYVLTAARRPGA